MTTNSISACACTIGSVSTWLAAAISPATADTEDAFVLLISGNWPYSVWLLVSSERRRMSTGGDRKGERKWRRGWGTGEGRVRGEVGRHGGCSPLLMLSSLFLWGHPVTLSCAHPSLFPSFIMAGVFEISSSCTRKYRQRSREQKG